MGVVARQQGREMRVPLVGEVEAPLLHQPSKSAGPIRFGVVKAGWSGASRVIAER